MAIIERLRGIYRFVKTYGQHLPMALRALVDLRCTVKLLKGRPPGRDAEVSVLYVGRGQNLPYLCRTLFETHRIEGEARTSVIGHRRTAERWLRAADLLVVDIGWPYHYRINRSGAYLEVPDWIDMGIDTEGGFEDVKQRFRRDARRNDLRRVRRGGYRCEITSDRRAIADFYDRQYEPYVRFAHGDGAFMAPKWHVVRQGAKGALLQVVLEDEVVAGGIVYPADDVLVSLWMGLPPHLHENPPDAVISALYVFLIRYAIDYGYAWVDFAGTRGFLNDGVFQFKRKWGAEIDDGYSPSSLLLQAQNANPNTLGLLENLPVLTRGSEGLEAVIVRGDPSSIDDCVRAAERTYGIRGLRKITILATAAGRKSTVVRNREYGVEYRIEQVPPASLPDCYRSGWLRGDADGSAAGDDRATEGIHA